MSEMEEKYMQAWNIVDELQVLLRNFEDIEPHVLKEILSGLAKIYALKFNEGWEEYENLLQSRKYDEGLTQEDFELARWLKYGPIERGSIHVTQDPMFVGPYLEVSFRIYKGLPNSIHENHLWKELKKHGAM